MHRCPNPKPGNPRCRLQKPEDWPRLFEQHLNAGDLEAVVALYEPDARFVTRSGETIVGRDRIRDVLAGLIGTKTRLQSRVIKAVTVGDVALLYTDFAGHDGRCVGKDGRGPPQGDRGPSPPARRHLEAHRGRPQRPRMTPTRSSFQPVVSEWNLQLARRREHRFTARTSS